MANPTGLAGWHEARIEQDLQRERALTTMSKMAVESPILNAVLRSSPRRTIDMTVGKAAVEAPLLRAAGVKRSDVKVADVDLASAFDQLSARLEDISNQPMSPSRARSRFAPNNSKLTPEKLGMVAVREDSRVNVSYVRPAVHLLLAQFPEPPTPADLKEIIFKKLLHIKIDDPYLGLNDVILPGTPGG
jgi:hypothetical protein